MSNFLQCWERITGEPPRHLCSCLVCTRDRKVETETSAAKKERDLRRRIYRLPDDYPAGDGARAEPTDHTHRSEREPSPAPLIEDKRAAIKPWWYEPPYQPTTRPRSSAVPPTGGGDSIQIEEREERDRKMDGAERCGAWIVGLILAAVTATASSISYWNNNAEIEVARINAAIATGTPVLAEGPPIGADSGPVAATCLDFWTTNSRGGFYEVGDHVYVYVAEGQEKPAAPASVRHLTEVCCGTPDPPAGPTVASATSTAEDSND